MTDRSKIQGEGDRESARKYNEDTQEFIKSGKVEEAAKRAKPSSPEEEEELRKAEEKGKEHAKK